MAPSILWADDRRSRMLARRTTQLIAVSLKAECEKSTLL